MRLWGMVGVYTKLGHAANTIEKQLERNNWWENVMLKRSGRQRRHGAWAGRLWLALLLAVLAGCSAGSGSGGPNYSLGLAGSTADHQSQPPTIAASGPGGSYAFVYDNQIWLRQSGQQAAKQLTHMALSNGSTIKWGPLVWSPTGKYLAFTVVQDLATGTAPESSGPLYYMDMQSHTVYATAGTGSIYGHTYMWYGDNMLFYASGDGIMMYALTDGSGNQDPRAWAVVTPFTLQQSYQSTTYSGSGYSYSDISIASGNLYFTQIHLTSFGSASATGDAALWQIPLSNLTPDTLDPGTLAGILPLSSSGAQQVTDLGQAYTDPEGDVVAGTWQVSSDGNTLVTQHIDSVDTKGGMVSSSFCVNPANGCTSVLQAAHKQPISARPEMSLSPSGDRVAFTGSALYMQSTDGSGAASLPSVSWFTPPTWANDKTVVATQLVKSSTDANNVTHYDTALVLFGGGASGALVVGAQNFSLK